MTNPARNPVCATPVHARTAWLQACCWLFVPGDRPERFGRAAAAGAAVVIVDLEASVLPARKEAARANVRAWLMAAERPRTPVLVRVNAPASPWLADDLRALADLPAGPGFGLMLAGSETEAGLAQVRAAMPAGWALVPLIESAAGVLNALALARAPGVDRLAFGNMDYQTDIGSEAREALVYPSSVLVAASRAAGLAAPMAGVTAAFRDAGRLAADLAFERALGFGGKLCIHPDQVGPIVAAFRPTAERLDWARRVLAASRDSHAVEVDGELVDRPVIDRARRLLEQVGADRGGPPDRAAPGEVAP